MKKFIRFVTLTFFSFLIVFISTYSNAEGIDWSKYCKSNGNWVTSPAGNQVYECPCSLGGKTCYYLCKDD